MTWRRAAALGVALAGSWALAFAAGRWTRPEAVAESRQVTQAASSAATQAEATRTAEGATGTRAEATADVVQDRVTPSGERTRTVWRTRTVADTRVEYRDRIVERRAEVAAATATRIETVTTRAPVADSRALAAHILGGVDDSRAAVIGAHVTRRILGHVEVGSWVIASRDGDVAGGISVGVRF